MSDNYVGNVLGILRLLKNTNLGQGAPGIVREWIGTADPTDPQVARIQAYVLEQAAGASALIKQSPLPDEAKAGLLQTTAALAQAFALQSVNNQMGSFFPQLDTALASFAILAGVTNPNPQSTPVEVGELIDSIKLLYRGLGEADLDPVVLETARRHLTILVTMLSHVEAFGVDAALVAYFEMVARLKRTTTAATSSTKEKIAALWPEIERWAGRLAIIDQAVNHGTSLLTHFSAVPHLLQYIPNPTGG